MPTPLRRPQKLPRSHDLPVCGVERVKQTSVGGPAMETRGTTATRYAHDHPWRGTLRLARDWEAAELASDVHRALASAKTSTLDPATQRVGDRVRYLLRHPTSASEKKRLRDERSFVAAAREKFAALDAQAERHYVTITAWNEAQRAFEVTARARLGELKAAETAGDWDLAARVVRTLNEQPRPPPLRLRTAGRESGSSDADSSDNSDDDSSDDDDDDAPPLDEGAMLDLMRDVLAFYDDAIFGGDLRRTLQPPTFKRASSRHGMMAYTGPIEAGGKQTFELGRARVLLLSWCNLRWSGALEAVAASVRPAARSLFGSFVQFLIFIMEHELAHMLHRCELLSSPAGAAARVAAYKSAGDGHGGDFWRIFGSVTGHDWALAELLTRFSAFRSAEDVEAVRHTADLAHVRDADFAEEYHDALVQAATAAFEADAAERSAHHRRGGSLQLPVDGKRAEVTEVLNAIARVVRRLDRSPPFLRAWRALS